MLIGHYDSEAAMRSFVIAGVVLLGAFGGSAHASCANSATWISQAVINSAVGNNTICARPASGYTGSSNDRWQEEHHTGGALWDYKLGDGNKVDPRTQVGTWTTGSTSTNGNAHGTITHSYTGGSSYVFSMYLVSTDIYGFCAGGTEVVRGKIKTGVNVGCMGDFP
jgi:hypothetical protein